MASSRSEVKDEVPQLQSPISPSRTLRRTGRQLDLAHSSRASTPDPSPRHPQIGSSPRLSVALKTSETDCPRPKSNLQGFGSLLRLPWTRSTDSLSDRGYESQGSRRTSSSSSYSLLSRTGRDSRASVTSATSLEDEETENSYEHPETKVPARSHSLLRQSGNCTVLPEETKHILTSDSETQTEQNGSICEEPHYSHSEILHQINRTVSSIDQRVQTVEVEVHSVKEKVMKINEKLNGIDNPQKDGPFRQQQSEQPFLGKGLTLIPEEEGSSRRSVILSPGKKREMRPWKSELLKGEYVEVDDVSIISVTVGRDQPLSENEIKAIVKKHCKEFVRHMNWVTILPTLESENLLDSHSAEFLMNTNTTSQLKETFVFDSPIRLLRDVIPQTAASDAAMSFHSCPASPNLQKKILPRQKCKTNLCSHSFSTLQDAVASHPQSENVVNVSIVDEFHAEEVPDQNDNNTHVHSPIFHSEMSPKSTKLPSQILLLRCKVSNQHDEGYLSREVSSVSLNSLDHETSRVSNGVYSETQLLSCSDLDSSNHLPSQVTDAKTRPQERVVTPASVLPDSSAGDLVKVMKRLDILEEEVKQLQSSTDVQHDGPHGDGKSERRKSCCFPSPSPHDQLVPKQRKLSGTAHALRRMERVDEESEDMDMSEGHVAVVRNPKWLSSEKKSKSIDVVIKVTPPKHRLRRCISDVVRGQYYEKEDAPFVELQTSVSNVAKEDVSSIQSQVGWAMSSDEEIKGSETTPPEEELKKRLTSQVPKFIKHTNWNYLVPHLVAKGLLDGSNTEKLLSGSRTEHEKGVLFYLRVLPYNGEDAYTTFYKCLQEETEHFGHLSLLKLLQNIN